LVLATPLCALDSLPAAGRVRVRGTLIDHDTIQSRGVRLGIELDPHRTIREDVEVGGEVEVVGEIVNPGGGYRGGPSRIGSGAGMLILFERRDRLDRRLLVAAVVELIAACGLFLCLAGLGVFAWWVTR